MPLGLLARIFAVAFLLAGILGFVPSLAQSAPMSAHLVVGTTALLLGIFPINVLHNIVHIIVGLWGLGAGRSYGGARSYFRALAVFYALLVILGLIPLTDTFFGMIPIFGYDVWLHGVTAVVAGYLGYATPAPQQIDTTA